MSGDPTPEEVVQDWLEHDDARSVLEALDAAGYVVLRREDSDTARLRELCEFLIDACATHRIPVPLNSSLLDLAADIAGGAGVAAVEIHFDTGDSHEFRLPAGGAR